MIKRTETNLYKREAIKEDINNAVGIAESADATAGTALSRATYEYGVCTDSSDTQNKVVVIENFPELYVGATCTVTFRNRNTAQSPTLNVNGTGAKTIYARGSGLSARSGYNWENGAVLRFIYDGTYWVMMPQSMQEAVNVLAGSNENSQTQIMYVEQGRVYINADYITTGSLDASIIATTELNAANITVGKIQGTQIEADAIKAEHLATDSVTADAIKANSIGASEIIAGSITGTEIASNSIESKHIVANSIEASDIAANAITTAKIAADAITADKIATDAVTADAIMANSVGTDELKADSVTATEIASNTITANEIAANAITASELSANSVTSVKIATGAVTADKIQAGAVTADKIQAGAITTEKLGAIEISADSITGGEISSSSFRSKTTYNELTISSAELSLAHTGMGGGDGDALVKLTAGAIGLNNRKDGSGSYYGSLSYSTLSLVSPYGSILASPGEILINGYNVDYHQQTTLHGWYVDINRRTGWVDAYRNVTLTASSANKQKGSQNIGLPHKVADINQLFIVATPKSYSNGVADYPVRISAITQSRGSTNRSSFSAWVHTEQENTQGIEVMFHVRYKI